MGGKKIETIWAFVALCEDGDEGVAAMLVGNTWRPLMAADPERLASIEQAAQRLATMSGQTLELRRYTTMTVLRTIEP